MKRSSFNEGWIVTDESTNVVRRICLPDDATLTKERNPKAESGRSGAFFPGGIYSYEKEWKAPEDLEDKVMFLEFEGVYPKAEVYVNDKLTGKCDYGYSTFSVELKNLKAGAVNRIRVRVDDEKHPNSRWYAGAGIYRPVWLMIGEKKAYIKPYGVKIKTLSAAPAEILVNTDHNGGDKIRVSVWDKEKLVVEAEGSSTKLQIPDAKLWSAESPYLYSVKVELMDQGVTADTVTVKTGIRKLSWSADGFLLNGKRVLLKGGCVHHDNGILGAKSIKEAAWRKVLRMKAFGFNAVRSAHNPIDRYMLEACDALGMYVMDEAWDTWYKNKNPYDCANGFKERYETDLRELVDKDYNHPSVVMYSIGNEVTEPAKKEGVRLLQTLVETMHRLDDTRPVTCGMNITLLLLAKLPFDPISLFAGSSKGKEEETKEKERMSSEKYNEMIQHAGTGMNRINSGFSGDLASKCCKYLDITGLNYGVDRYEREMKKRPDKLIVGSETYCQEIGRTWPKIEANPQLVGDFMWTGWDYLGEAGIGGFSYDAEDFSFEKAYPWLLADTGAIDILGNDTAEAGLARVVWNKEIKPYIGVTPANHGGRELARAVWRGTNARPHWSYQGCDGAKVDVEVYTCASQVELFINDRSMGIKQVRDFQAVFSVNYEQGYIRAAAMDESGTVLSESALFSAAGNTKVEIKKESFCGPEQEVYYFDIRLVGENGEIECNADRRLTAKVTGGELLGFGSARPKTEESFLSGSYTTYFGRAQAIVRKTGEIGILTICDEKQNLTEISF